MGRGNKTAWWFPCIAIMVLVDDLTRNVYQASSGQLLNVFVVITVSATTRNYAQKLGAEVFNHRRFPSLL
jgi:hypothetical protein